MRADRTLLTLVASLASSATLLGACAEPLDTTRVAPARGTLGEEVFKVFCGRLAREAYPQDVDGSETRDLCAGAAPTAEFTPPRLRALVNERARLVSALDRALPESLEDDLQYFLVRMLPLYDLPDERLPALTRAAADLLDRLANDPSALEALRKHAGREGYRSAALELGALRPALSYVDLADLNAKVLAALEAGGAANDEWRALLPALALELATLEAEPRTPGTRSDLDLARELSFTQDPAFASGTPIWLVRRDARGLAVPAASGGSLRAPFVDGNGDGLADVDSQGQYVDGSGAPLHAPAPFPVHGEPPTSRDEFGRAVAPDGSLLYEYFDADRTLLAGLVRQTPELLGDGGALLDAALGLPALLGAPHTHTKQYGAATLSYAAPDPASSPLASIAHAATAVLARPALADALAANRALLRDHEGAVATLVDSALYVADRADAYPAARLVDDSPFWDDLAEVLAWMVQQPGLTEAVLRSMADPRSKRLGQIEAELMRYKDEVTYDPSDVNAPRRNVTFRAPVDRGAPDVQGNESIFQRTVSLIHDVNGVKLCNKAGAKLVISLAGTELLTWPMVGSYDECELMEVPNAAELYAQAIIGRAEIELKDPMLTGMMDMLADLGLDLVSVDDLMEMQSEIDGFSTHPTPEAINRFIFAPRNEFLQHLVDPPLTRDGVPVEDRHQGTIFTWEREYVFADGLEPSRVTFYEALTPLLEAFDTYDRRTDGRFLFGELMSVLHRHWGSRTTAPGATTQRTDPNAPFYAYQSDVVSYEELLATAFDGGRLLIALHELSAALAAVEVAPGVDGIAAMAAAAEELADPNRNVRYTYRNGAVVSTSNDGARAIPATPLYEVLDALQAIDEARAREPERTARWEVARRSLVEALLGPESTATGLRLKNQRGRAVSVHALGFLLDRLAEHRAAGDLDAWASDLQADLEEALRSPMVGAGVPLLAALGESTEARDANARFLSYLTGDASPNHALANVVADGADLLQVLEDDDTLIPLVRALAPAAGANVREVVAGGGTVVSTGSLLDAAVRVGYASGQVDERKTFAKVLGGLVARAIDEPETPIETILDVIAAVNRAEPGSSADLSVPDYAAILGQTRDFMRDERRGLERLHDVIQSRRLAP